MELREFLETKLQAYQQELVKRQQQLQQLQARIYQLQGAIDVCQDTLHFLQKREGGNNDDKEV